MGDCDICEGDDHISYRCNECDGQFCSQHRLPESHNCSALRITYTAEEEPETPNSNTEESVNTPPQERTKEPDSETQDESEEDRDYDPSSCTECGRVTGHECEQCGGIYCKRHKAPSVHDCPERQISSMRTVSREKRSSINTRTKPGMPSPTAGRESSNDSRFPSHNSLRSRLIRNWKLVLMLTVVAGGAGLAATGYLDTVVEETVSAANSGGSDGDSDGVFASDTLNESRIEDLVHERVNEVRANRSVSRLDHDAVLREIASKYSRKMATEGFYSHTSPDGGTFEDRYAKAGYTCRAPISSQQYATGAENINVVYAFTTVNDGGGTYHADSEKEVAQIIVRQWMDSKGHRENILKTYWDDEGVGIAVVDNNDGSGKKVYATQNFC